MKKSKSREIFQNNLQTLLNQDPDSSMRNLSASIGASASYIQKVLNNKTTPSLDKIDSICEYFDVDCWEMFLPYSDRSQELLGILQIINGLPTDALPTVKAFLEFMQNLNSE